MKYDLLVVGAGFAGSIAARELAEAGMRVLIQERRPVIGGNMYDERDKNGILLHRYGPHTFHTAKKELYDYICRFGNWQDYRLECAAVINGKSTPSPFNFQTVDDFFPAREAEAIKTALQSYYPGLELVPITRLLESENIYIRSFAGFLFENNYRPYTTKQWGLAPDEIDVSILKRVPVRMSYGKGYFDDYWQCVPKDSYTDFFNRMLDHPRITVQCNVDALDRLHLTGKQLTFQDCKLPIVYTGAIDELVNRVFQPAGQLAFLPYRSLRFQWETRDVECSMPAPVTQYPQAEGFTRITEHKFLTHHHVEGVTTIAVEYPLEYAPYKGLEPYYPILSEGSALLYRQYTDIADTVNELYLCGRLAEFKYYNMDQVVESALTLANRLKGELL